MFIDSVRLESAELKDCSRVLRLSVFLWCWERPQIVILWVDWFGRLKWRVTDLEASLTFLHHEGVRGRCLQVFSLFLLCRLFLYSVLQVMQLMTLVEMHVNRSIMLMVV